MTEPTYDELREQYRRVELENEELRSRAKRRRRLLSRHTKLLAVAAIILLAAPTAAVVLFSQTMHFTGLAAKVVSVCATPTDAITGNILTFTCSGSYALSVPQGATGSVSYTAMSGSPPQVLDWFLVDTGGVPGATCALYTATGNEPVALAAGGGTVSIGATAGMLRAGHNYYFCADLSSLPPAFDATITWSQ